MNEYSHLVYNIDLLHFHLLEDYACTALLQKTATKNGRCYFLGKCGC